MATSYRLRAGGFGPRLVSLDLRGVLATIAGLRDCDVQAGRATGQLRTLDAQQPLHLFMADGAPQWKPFRAAGKP